MDKLFVKVDVLVRPPFGKEFHHTYKEKGKYLAHHEAPWIKYGTKTVSYCDKCGMTAMQVDERISE